MQTVTRRSAEAYPKSNTGWDVRVEPLKNNFLPRETQSSLWLLLGVVGFVLLIACVNVANLMLARGTARQRELAVRAVDRRQPRPPVRAAASESLSCRCLGARSALDCRQLCCA